MAELLDYIPSIALGTNVTQITKKPVDGYTAAGFSAFMLSISGENPTVVNLGKNRAQIVLSKKQVVDLQKFLDVQLKNIVSPLKPPTLDIALGPAIIPWMLKFAVPAAIILILTGWFAHSHFGR
jgi:hypothetical protein